MPNIGNSYQVWILVDVIFNREQTFVCCFRHKEGLQTRAANLRQLGLVFWHVLLLIRKSLSKRLSACD